MEPTKVEEGLIDVEEQLKRGCGCQRRCFQDLNADIVYKHQLNIAELTKYQRDMYLMGVTMASLLHSDVTRCGTERKRIRSQYSYKGRTVCLDAFVYLENCTHYQLKCIRKHVTTNGVVPRVHGNRGKKLYNHVNLDVYKNATEFLNQFIEQHMGFKNISNSKQTIKLPSKITRKSLYDAYREYIGVAKPMEFSSFRYFMKRQFPHVKILKFVSRSGHKKSNRNLSTNDSASETIELMECKEEPKIGTDKTEDEVPSTQIENYFVNNEEQQLIQLVIVPPHDDTSNAQYCQEGFLLPPLQLI